MLRTKSGPAIPSSMIRYPWTRFLTGCAAAGSGASIPGRFPVPFFLPDDNFLNRNPSIIDRPMTGLYSGCRTLCYNERSQQQRQRNPGGRCVKRIIALFFIVVSTVHLPKDFPAPDRSSAGLRNAGNGIPLPQNRSFRNAVHPYGRSIRQRRLKIVLFKDRKSTRLNSSHQKISY